MEVAAVVPQSARPREAAHRLVQLLRRPGNVRTHPMDNKYVGRSRILKQDEHLHSCALILANRSFPSFPISQEIKQILLSNQKIRSESDSTFYLKYTDIWVGKPCIDEHDVRTRV